MKKNHHKKITLEQEEEVIRLFLTEKNNQITEIKKKMVCFSEHTISKVIDRYLKKIKL